MLAAIRQNGLALQDADASLRKDKDIVLAAVQQDGEALQYADASLKKDRDVVLIAVQQNGSVLQHADESLKNDLEIVKAALKQNRLVWYDIKPEKIVIPTGQESMIGIVKLPILATVINFLIKNLWTSTNI